MGIGIVLLVAAVVGTAFASIGMIALGGATAFFTRGVKKNRRKAIIAASAFPFVCLAWGGAVFFFQATVNEGVFDRDPGLGDAWHCPLPNGYALMMIDVTDYGWVYNPKTQVGGGVGEQEDAIFGVRAVQVAGRYVMGGIDSKIPDDESLTGNNYAQMDSYFLMDSETGKRSDFRTYDELNSAAQTLGIQPDLRHIDDVYRKYRFTWFDTFAAFLLFVPPVVAAGLLLRWILRLRRTRVEVFQTV
jgi:energy-coupling factor transporter transmembrane protein EcfT